MHLKIIIVHLCVYIGNIVKMCIEKSLKGSCEIANGIIS